MTPPPAPRALVVINGDDVFLSHGPPPHESRFQVEIVTRAARWAHGEETR